jgi:hypothetical protein
VRGCAPCSRSCRSRPAPTDDFKARLAPVPIDSTNSAATTGVGSATRASTGTTLKLNGSFSGLHGPRRRSRS